MVVKIQVPSILVKMLILPQYKLKLDIGEYIAFWI